MARPTLSAAISLSSGGGGTTLTLPNVVVASGEQLLTIVGCGNNGVNDDVVSVIRNAESQTRKWFKGDTNFCATYGYAITAPAVGTFNTVVTFGGSGPGQQAASSFAMAGVSSTAGVATASQTAGTLPIIFEPTPQTVVDLVVAHNYTDTAINVLPRTGVQIEQINSINSDSSHNIMKIDSGGYVEAVWEQGNDGCAMAVILLQGTADAGTIPTPPINDRQGISQPRYRQRIF